MWLAECVINKKKENPRITLEAAIPCYGQENIWPQEAKNRYYDILKQCDIQTVVSKDKYKPCYMIRRNEYMVNKSDIVISCYDGTSGGTRKAFFYAMDKGKKIINIDPKRREVRLIQH